MRSPGLAEFKSAVIYSYFALIVGAKTWYNRYMRDVAAKALAASCATAIQTAFDAYQAAFKAVTHRAQQRFEQCDWPQMQADAEERLDLYKVHVDGPSPRCGPAWAPSPRLKPSGTR